MVFSTHPSGLKTATIFKTFYSIDAQHRFAKIGMKLIKNRLSQSGRQAQDTSVNSATKSIAMVF